MPRHLRIHFPNACYHVMNRGAGRQKIFKNNSHRVMFLDLLEESQKMFNLKILAYCLMDNHYHLQVSTPDANLSRAMRHINGVYTQKFNRLVKKDGSLFRGRYKAQLVDEDCYQLFVSRYIHLNPVEAGLVSKPADYRWSSYSAYLGLIKTPDWLSTNVILDQLSETKALSHVKNYQDYVEGKCIEEINVFASIKHTLPIIGSEVFKEKMLSMIDVSAAESFSSDLKRAKTIPEIKFIINQICLFYNVSPELLIHCKPGTSNWPKLVCMYICRKAFGHTLRDIASSMGFRRYEAVSTSVQKCHSQLQKYPVLFNEVHSIIKHIKKLILQETQ